MCQSFKKVLIFLIFLQEVYCAVEFDKSLTASRSRKYDKSLTISRKKRIIPPPPPLFPSILYGYNAATGILCAIGMWSTE